MNCFILLTPLGNKYISVKNRLLINKQFKLKQLRIGNTRLYIYIYIYILYTKIFNFKIKTIFVILKSFYLARIRHLRLKKRFKMVWNNQMFMNYANLNVNAFVPR